MVAMRAASWALGTARRTAVAEKLAGLGSRVLRGRRAPGGRRVLGALPWPASAWSDARDVPIPAAESFRTWWARTDGGRAPTPTPREGTPRPDRATGRAPGDDHR